MKYLKWIICPVLFWSCAAVEEKSEEIVASLPIVGETAPLRYSENPQVAVPSHRQYRKMTKGRMEEESDLGASAGSMWQMDGQSSYLFIQNKTRREGDVLNVKLEGAAQKQVETKVKVIKKLLKQIEAQENRSASQQMAQNQQAQESDQSRNPATAAAAAAANAAAIAAQTQQGKSSDDEKTDLSDIQSIPTRIVEKLPDGNYRVKGAQPFMIDKREYKVIVMGLIRPEDYNDEGINSSKLLDPQFDVVNIRRIGHE